MGDSGQCYAPSSGTTPLRQCEILSGVRQLAPKAGDAWSESPRFDLIGHPYAIVLSQDCDLEQDYRSRSVSPPDPRLMLPSVLLCEAVPASEEKQQPKISAIWKQVTQNNHERFHYLSRIAANEDSAGIGIESLVLDFKRYFTVPTDDLYEQCKLGAARRVFLNPNYLEHVTTRFCYYQYRVALAVTHLARESGNAGIS